jgi:hypothetical protein
VLFEERDENSLLSMDYYTSTRQDAAQPTEKRNSLRNASLGATINWLRLRLQFASYNVHRKRITLVPSRLRRDVPSCPDGYVYRESLPYVCYGRIVSPLSTTTQEIEAARRRERGYPLIDHNPLSERVMERENTFIDKTSCPPELVSP